MKQNCRMKNKNKEAEDLEYILYKKSDWIYCANMFIVQHFPYKISLYVVSLLFISQEKCS